jgi:hypothetical protein
MSLAKNRSRTCRGGKISRMRSLRVVVLPRARYAMAKAEYLALVHAHESLSTRAPFAFARTRLRSLRQIVNLNSCCILLSWNQRSRALAQLRNPGLRRTWRTTRIEEELLTIERHFSTFFLEFFHDEGQRLNRFDRPENCSKVSRWSNDSSCSNRRSAICAFACQLIARTFVCRSQVQSILLPPSAFISPWLLSGMEVPWKLSAFCRMFH